jgi:hypothetical protein
MPCTCHYNPPDASKRLIRAACEMIVREVKLLSEIGDPSGCGLSDVKDLIDHLYYSDLCDEKPKEK